MMRSWLLRKVIYPGYELLAKRRILPLLQEFEQSQWLPAADMQRLQSERLSRLIEHAWQNVPYYRHRMQACKLPQTFVSREKFLDFPILKKVDIQDQRRELTAANFSTRDLKINATGGSTGHSLEFVNDHRSLDYRTAVTVRGDRWAGLDIGTPHARLWGAPMDIKPQQRLTNRLGNWLLNRLWLDSFRLSDIILASYIQKIQRFRPKVLLGYASALETLGKYLEVHATDNLSLQAVISSAETLFPEQRALLERVLQCKVYNRYGCREAGPLAMECSHGNLHVNADYVYLEIIRADGQAAQPGETGEILITPLFGLGMPFIRYQVGDLGVAAQPTPCPCGRGLPTLQRIIGRSSDMFVNSRGELFHGEYFTHLFYHHPGIRQFQVIQNKPDKINFRLVTTGEVDLKTQTEIETSLRNFVGKMDVTWEFVEVIEPLSSGKRCFTISTVRDSDQNREI